MKAISEVMRQAPDALVNRVRAVRPGDGETRCISQGGITVVCLTREELGRVGYRELTNDAGQRVGQFGLCRDTAGLWVYAPLRQPDETVEQMLERNRQTRQRMGFCAKRQSATTLRGFDE